MKIVMEPSTEAEKMVMPQAIIYENVEALALGVRIANLIEVPGQARTEHFFHDVKVQGNIHGLLHGVEDIRNTLLLDLLQKQMKAMSGNGRPVVGNS